MSIVIDHLSWTPDNAGSPVLSDISLTLEEGHMTGIIGPNGSGKSSLLRHILRFLPVREGEIDLDGKAISTYPRKKLAGKLSFVPQKTWPDTDITAEEMVLTGRNPYISRFGRESAEDVKKAEEAMVMTGTMQFRERNFNSLSGGEAQRVVVARAVAQGTPWMLLDEPVSSLDVRQQLAILESLKALNLGQGISVVIVLHDINLASVWCDRLVMLKEGKLLAAGRTGDVLNREKLKELYGLDFFPAEGEDGFLRWYPYLRES